MKDLIDQLQRWYTSQCDDVWEHSFGVEIANIDNPGWKVKITGASAKQPLDIRSERTDDDWVRVSVVNGKVNSLTEHKGEVATEGPRLAARRRRAGAIRVRPVTALYATASAR